MEKGETIVEQLRTALATATRMLVEASILGYSGHLSARVPDEEEQLFIQPVDEPRSALLPDGVLRVTFDGKVLDGEGKPPSELAIHTGVYRARPDVGAVAHFHHDPTTMFTMVDGGAIVPVKNHASRWASGVPAHPDPSHIDTPEQGAAVAATLGACDALLLRAHGEVVVSEDVTALFADVLHFVENADALARAMALGPVRPLGPDDCNRFLATFDRCRHARKVWKYHVAVAVAHGTLPAEWADGTGVAGVGRAARAGVRA